MIRWMDGFLYGLQFSQQHFYGLSPEELYEKLLQGEEIESSFDVLEYLFPGFAGGGISITSEEELSFTEPESTEEPYRYEPPTDVPTEARALAAAMLADGKIHPEEERLIDRYLKDLGLLLTQLLLMDF